jgi:NAD(P) transhydrogenase subunit alpha
MTEVLLGAYVFILAIIVGFEVIGRVPAMLHTPLMSVVAGQAHTLTTRILGFVAVVLGSLNVFGGFVVTDRMLEMFRPRRRERP